MKIKKVKRIIIILCIIWLIFSNYMWLEWSMIFVDREKSEQIKETFSLPNNTNVILIAIENSIVSHPEIKIFYRDGIQIESIEGRYNQSTEFGKVNYSGTNICQYIWISSLITIIIVMITTIVCNRKGRIQNDKERERLVN